MTSASTWQRWAAGTRVVVRRRLSAEEAAASGRKVTDLIGVVIESGDWGVQLRPDAARDDPATARPVTITAEQIVAAKTIPPRRVPRA